MSSMEDENQMVSASLGKLKQLDLAEARAGAEKLVPWGKFKHDFAEPQPLCRICPCMKPPCMPWCLWYHHAYGTAVPMVLLCHLSSQLWAAIAERAAATEYP